MAMHDHHRKPCANCGHRDLHSTITGCTAVTSTNPDVWCPCDTYAEPPAKAPTPTTPVTPYAGTSGHSGSATSRDRAIRNDSSGVTGKTQQGVLDLARDGGTEGVTVAEARGVLDAHHGTVSGALSTLHLEGYLARLTETRNRCAVYVLPECVNGRETQAHGRSKPKPTPPTREALSGVIRDAYYEARNSGRTMDAAGLDAADRVLALLAN